MKGIYICYEETDLELASKITEMFELENIPNADLDNADVYLFLFTDNSNQSQTIINKLQRIISLDKKFLTLKSTDSLPSDELSFFISTTQWLDMRQKDSFKQLFTRVIKQLR